MEQAKVATIILNYNGRPLLEQYLPSIMSLEYENNQVIIVDNDSTDGSVDFVRDNFPDVDLIQNTENLGISKGLNKGAEAAPDADYMLFLNNDVKVTPTSLSRLVEYVRENSETGVVFPRINEMGSERIQSLGHDYDMFAHGAFPARDQGQKEPTDSSPQEITVGKGAAMLVSREVWEAVGGFDENNFIYGDDTYLCLQSWIRGFHVKVVPESVVYHEEEATLKEDPFVAFHEIRSDCRTYLKCLQLRTLLLGFPGHIIFILGTILKDLTVRRTPRIGLARLKGFFSALASIPEIYRSRRDVYSERVYPDSRYLTPVRETMF